MEGLSACECPVCFHLLNHTSREPMSMPCGHTFCKVCVNQLGDKATSTVSKMGVVSRPTFQCPLCRQWVNVDAVTLNVTLRDLLAELGKMDEKRVLPLGTALNVCYSEVAMEEVLDRGAFGEVCRGRWRGNEVAVKLFSTGRPTPETMEAFQREVFVMNCLRHPNVVLLLGACQTPPKLAIIMEFIAGGSLHQLIHVDKARPSVTEIAQLATDICRGLQYLHSINVLHRDLKSKNVLLTGPIPCQAKLCDFGLSRMRQESATMTGNVGTVHWTAPEVLNSQRYRFSADVYGFGMVLYEMVSGRVPLGHMVPMAVMLAVAVRRERPVVPDNAHPTFQQLIKECSEWEAGDRPSLPSILTSLSSLLPHPQPRGERGGKGGREHQDSLGVVFLSATDSADLNNQDEVLARIARQVQEATQPQQAPPQAPPPAPLNKRTSYEDLVLSPPPSAVSDEKKRLPTMRAKSSGKKTSVRVRPEPESEMTSYNMAESFQEQEYSQPVDWQSERTSYNMAFGVQSLPFSHRTRGERNTLPTKDTTSLNMAMALNPLYISPSARPSAAPRVSRAMDRESERTSYNMASGLQAPPESGRRKHALGEGSAPWPPYMGRGEVSGQQPPAGDQQLTQLQLDMQLARQLQMRENSFLLPQDSDRISSGSSVFPPQPLLDTIKQKKFPPLKHVEATPTEATPTESSLRKRLGSLLTRKKSKKSATGSSQAPPPPPPPALPPARRHLSPRQVLLREVQNRAPTVARQLKPVQTIEKRAFRVGHVVGGYDPHHSLFTTQNLIESFNKHRLRTVTVREPSPAFPVGRVVQSRVRVKRMSSHLETSFSPISDSPAPPPLPPLPSSPPRRRLHPAIRSAVERFSRSDLHHVQTIVRQKLPDKEEMEQEKKSKLVQEILEFDRSLLVTVDTVYKNKLPSADMLEIERRQAVNSDLTLSRDLVLHSVLTFDPSGLHHVVTEVKNRLPSVGTIEMEKRSTQGEQPTD